MFIKSFDWVLWVLCILSKCDWMNISSTRDIVTVNNVKKV